ncbi:LINE-1 reverse transcriptase-like protein [Bienertia sinuspersici]
MDTAGTTTANGFAILQDQEQQIQEAKEVEEMQGRLNRSNKQREVQVVGSTHLFLCTFVYGYNEATARNILWRDLIDIANNSSLCWLVLGDFNNVLNFNERIGAPIREKEIKDFRQCLQMCSLTDIESFGNFNTWNNKQDAETRVYSKIDWALGNMKWLQKFENSAAQFLPEGDFDHSPIIVHLFQEEHSG